MSAANWISGAVRGKRQARVDRKLRRREGKAECAFGPPAEPDENGCFGWPRACNHHDDLDCLEADELRWRIDHPDGVITPEEQASIDAYEGEGI